LKIKVNAPVTAVAFLPIATLSFPFQIMHGAFIAVRA
jgi:hypothetical protein